MYLSSETFVGHHDGHLFPTFAPPKKTMFNIMPIHKLRTLSTWKIKCKYNSTDLILGKQMQLQPQTPRLCGKGMASGELFPQYAGSKSLNKF
jgi:hypothetical protein